MPLSLEPIAPPISFRGTTGRRIPAGRSSNLYRVCGIRCAPRWVQPPVCYTLHIGALITTLRGYFSSSVVTLFFAGIVSCEDLSMICSALAQTDLTYTVVAAIRLNSRRINYENFDGTDFTRRAWGYR